MASCMMIKTLGALRAADQEAEEMLAKFKNGETYKVEIKRDRSGKQDRLYWKMCSVVATHTDHYNKNQIDKIIKFGTGNYDLLPVRQPDGQVKLFPEARSIAHDKMEGVEFSAYLDKAINYVISALLPVAKADLEREVYELVGIPMEA